MSELRHVERLLGVHPKLTAFARLVASQSPVDWCVVTGVRSLAGVLEKYAQGRTTKGPHAGAPGYPPLGLTITNVSTLEGAPHAERLTPEGLYACAVDLQFLTHSGGKLASGDSPAEVATYRWYGALAEAQGLLWGGRFTKVDQAHVELPHWRLYPLPSAAPVS
jgi:hypothetical protein